MDVDKLPRWVLVAGFIGFMSLGGLMLKGAFADLETTKDTVAKHDLLIPQVMEDIKSIKTSNETFRIEYRQDNVRSEEKLRQMEDRIIKAVKA